MRNFLWSLWYKYKEWRFERKCIKHLGMKPTKMYVTKEQYSEQTIYHYLDKVAQEQMIYD